jgi:LysM repeat protein
MRTKTIARWRRGALAGTLAASLVLPAAARAQQPAATEPQPAAQPPAATEKQPAAQPPAATEPQTAAPEPQGEPAQKPENAVDAPAQKPENAPVVTEQSPRPPPDTNIQPVPGTPEEYTIQKGDTLWDLSQKFLNNPWYWPKIWSLNPAIENPHWIYPGNKLRIVPGEGGAQAPAQVAGVDANAANAAPEEQPSVGEGSTSVSPPISADMEVVNRNSQESQNSLNSVSVSGKLAFTPPAVVSVRTSGLVTPEEMANVGRLDASFEEKEMLATYDTAYVEFKNGVPAKPGDKLIIFRPEGAITNPITHQKVADQTKTVGVVKVLSIQGTQATVQVERTFEEIARGDLVRPWVPQDKRVAPRPNTTDVKGMIVQAVNPGLTTFGESNEVFIDKGSADGVQEGNTFLVVRQGDGLTNVLVTKSYAEGEGGAAAKSIKTPNENVGFLLVVDAREHVSTAIVVKSVRELQPGDLVEMHAAGAGGGAP